MYFPSHASLAVAASLMLSPSLILHADEAALITHESVAAQLVDVLARTELTLRMCNTPEEVKTALPKLLELKAEMEEILELQAQLADPSMQDFISAEPHIAPFTRVMDAIEAELKRLQESGLYSQELLDILRIKPSLRQDEPADEE